jgi:hypothetical protein
MLTRALNAKGWLCVWRVAAFLGTAATLIADQSYVDREVFPRGYTILSSDRLMFPQVVTDWPVKIDSRRQLFVDDYLIASMEGLQRRYHQPSKHPRNPLLVRDRPWEGAHIWVGTVLRDEPTGRFRMWYADGIERELYAESDDGITWRKPELGLVSHNGSTKNNITFEPGFMIGIIRDPGGEKGARGYLTLVYQTLPHVKQPGFYLYRSPDGLRWTGGLRRPVLTSTENPKLWSSVGMGDTSIFRHDPLLGRYVVDSKFNLYLPAELMKDLNKPVENNKLRIRTRTMAESDDLIHWTRPRYILFPDEHDERDSQIYGHISFVYESMWLGLVRVLHTERSGWKQVEIELTYSRDGRQWSRPVERQPFIPLGDADSWEPDYSDGVMNGPLLVGDELWFYYRGSRSNERDKTDYYTMSVGLARLRRDGFVSLDAGEKPGRLVTRPLTFAGKSLFVNVEVAERGWIKAAVLSRDSEPVAGYAMDDAVALTKGTTRGRMAWKTKPNLDPPGDDHVRIVFQLENAKLYSFWIE